MKKITFLLLLCFGYSLSYSQNENNTCADATVVTAGSYVVTAVNGTQVPTPICAGNGIATAGEWYKYQPAQNYTVTVTSDLAINTCGDTRLHIYTGTCSSLSCLTGDDDAGVIICPTNNNNSYLSTVTFTASAGTTYYIAFDNRWKSDGFTFQVIEQPFLAPPISFTTETIPTTSTICCVSDMNGDYLDDIVTVQSNQVTVLTQKAVGGYTTTTYPLSATVNLPDWSIAAGDFDRNGFNDLVLGNASRVTVLKADATGTGYTIMAYPQSIFTQRTNFIDINNDGHLDLWACHDVAQSHAYRNDGAGNLVFDISLMPTLAVGGNYATMWTDYDNDGDQDMYLAKCRGGAPVGDPQRINLLYTNNRINPSPIGTTNAFTENGAAAGVNDGSQSWSTAIEDFDNDGDMDFLLSNISDTNKLYRNNGNGTFTDVYSTTGIAPQVGSWEIQAHDFNNDGFTDFLWQNGKELYINNGNLTFTGYDLPFSEGAIGDLNNDGFLDLQYSNKVYYNVPNANKWITIKLQGIQSNRNGIGARVELYGVWGKQIRDIRSGTGFSHQSTLNAHFGIGAENTITKVIVRWPSGVVDVIDNPTINQSLLVVENSTTLGVAAFSNENFAVYPNPAKDILNIKVKTEITLQTIKIFDLTGKLVLNPEIKNQSISIQSLNKGTYFLLVKDMEGKDYAQKFIKE
jgi:ASPIC and UnbV/Secretion system C-terminal sorting domain/FG-GAP-like repeat